MTGVGVDLIRHFINLLVKKTNVDLINFGNFPNSEISIFEFCARTRDFFPACVHDYCICFLIYKVRLGIGLKFLRLCDQR